jgi:hypothetical protein
MGQHRLTGMDKKGHAMAADSCAPSVDFPNYREPSAHIVRTDFIDTIGTSGRRHEIFPPSGSLAQCAPAGYPGLFTAPS